MEAYLACPGITMPSPMAFRYWSRRTDAIGSSPGSGPPWKIRKFPAVKMRSAPAGLVAITRTREAKAAIRRGGVCPNATSGKGVGSVHRDLPSAGPLPSIALSRRSAGGCDGNDVHGIHGERDLCALQPVDLNHLCRAARTKIDLCLDFEGAPCARPVLFGVEDAESDRVDLRGPELIGLQDRLPAIRIGREGLLFADLRVV